MVFELVELNNAGYSKIACYWAGLMFCRCFDELQSCHVASRMTPIWEFNKDLVGGNTNDKFYEMFDKYLVDNVCQAQKGRIANGTKVVTKRPRLSEKETKQLNEGKVSEQRYKAHALQTDEDARRTTKEMGEKKNYQYGYHTAENVGSARKIAHKVTVAIADKKESRIFLAMENVRDSRGVNWESIVVVSLLERQNTGIFKKTADQSDTK